MKIRTPRQFGIISSKAILLLDVFITLIAVAFAYLLRFNFEVPHKEIESLRYIIPLILSVRVLTFYFLKTHVGLIRYASIEDALKIFVAGTAGTIVFILCDLLSNPLLGFNVIPVSIIILEYIFSGFFMTAYRLFGKRIYLHFRSVGGTSPKMVIYGAGEAGLLTKRIITRDMGNNYSLVAFIDDNPKLKNSRIEGIPVYGSIDELEKLFNEQSIELLTISILDLPLRKKQEVIETCLKHKVRVLTVPTMNRWINGELSFKQIRQVKIEDLLERLPIQLDVLEVKKQLNGKRILVTGAAGSIGSEIARQVLSYHPEQVVLLDQAETPLYELGVELGTSFREKCYKMVIGDVRNAARMRNLFATFRPEIVFHAAAYKHVPVMEENPSEAILTNIQGTRILADLAVEFQVEKFVLISTDKAVNPTNVMGASKRIAEMYVQSLNHLLDYENNGHTRFVTTRFGNVLGSNGSVIPIFRKQIQSGQPVTITHPDVTRFFMTIPEACQLVLEAGTMGNGGEIFIFDMGESVKIADLARKMIRLSGLELGKDISIVFTGLRPGEKLYEELLADQENTIPTHHPKIMIAKVREYEYDLVAQEIESLTGLFEDQDNQQIVRKMKDMVPEYVSNNSEFEVLDK